MQFRLVTCAIAVSSESAIDATDGRKTYSRLGTFAFLFLCAIGTGIAPLAGGKSPIVGLIAEFIVAGIFLAASITSRRSLRWQRFHDVFFAYFVFSMVITLRSLGIGLVSLGYDPSLILGQALIAIVDFLATVVTVVVLVKVSGRRLSSVYLQKGNLRLGLKVGIPALLILLFCIVAAFQVLYAGPHGISFSKVLSFLPLILFAVALNAPKEELWYRGLTIGRYQPLLGLRLSNLLQTTIFTTGHVEPQWIQFGVPFLIIFLVFVFVGGMGFGLIVQRTNSLIGSSLAHAGADIGVFLLLLSPFIK